MSTCQLCGALGVNRSTCPSNPLCKEPTQEHNPLILPDLSEVIKKARDIYAEEIYGVVDDILVPVNNLAHPLRFSVSLDDEFSHNKKTYFSVNIELSADVFMAKYKEYRGTCWRVMWFPELCLMAADGLLFGKVAGKRKQVSAAECFGDNISARWLMALRDGIAELLGIKYIIMGDETVLFIKGTDKYIDLRAHYVQKHNMTYYMKYGYIPLDIKYLEREDVLADIIDGRVLMPFDVKPLFAQIRSKKAYIQGQQDEWQSIMDEFADKFPHYYIKRIGGIGDCVPYPRKEKVTAVAAAAATVVVPSSVASFTVEQKRVILNKLGYTKEAGGTPAMVNLMFPSKTKTMNTAELLQLLS